MPTNCVAIRNQDSLFLQFEPIVVRVARSFARRVPHHISFDTLKSAGYLGLAQALRRWEEGIDPELFGGLVARRVRGAILDELRGMDVLTRRDRRKVRRLDSSERKLRAKLQRPVAADELAADSKLGLAECERLRAARLGQTTISLDESPHVVDSLQIEDVAARCDAKHVLELASTLSPRLQLVLGLYFFEGRNMREIGDELGVSESRVCQLRSEALNKLRAAMVAPRGN